MLGSIQAVVFDVDGVLIDSLPQHLEICRDKAEEFGLSLTIPTIPQFRRLVASGVKISPMLYFFLAVGFPLDDAKRATDDYAREFSRRYRPKLFAGVDAMLAALRRAGLPLGLVTSNLRANVAPVLCDVLPHFEPSGVFYLDSIAAPPRPKSWYLSQSAHALRADPASCLYVGDQPADLRAAREAGFQFLGVTYGWGLGEDAGEFESVDDVAGIAEKLVGQPAAARGM